MQLNLVSLPSNQHKTKQVLADHSHFQIPINADVLQNVLGAVDGTRRNTELLMGAFVLSFQLASTEHLMRCELLLSVTNVNASYVYLVFLFPILKVFVIHASDIWLAIDTVAKNTKCQCQCQCQAKYHCCIVLCLRECSERIATRMLNV